MKKNIMLFSVTYLLIFSIPFAVFLPSNISKNIYTDLKKIDILQNKPIINSKLCVNNSASVLKKQSNDKNKKDPVEIQDDQIKSLSKLINDCSEHEKMVLAKANEDKDQDNEVSLKNSKIEIKGCISTDGYFNIFNISTGKIDRVSERDYVIGAVCSEMPPTFHEEALKAQAVSAHTYALKLREDHKMRSDYDSNEADFSADPIHWNKYVTKEIARERFGEHFEEYWGKISSAVEDVVDVVMLYDDEPIIAAYHSICGGYTESAKDIWGGEAPYLVSTKSLGDNLAPDFETKISKSAKEMRKIFENNFCDIELPEDKSTWFTDINRSNSGSVLNLKVGQKNISGVQIRKLLGLRSTNFDVTYNSDSQTFDFNVKGYGHGIGLSQYGADYMGKNGSTFDQILNHYYYNISFSKVSNVA